MSSSILVKDSIEVLRYVPDVRSCDKWKREGLLFTSSHTNVATM